MSGIKPGPIVLIGAGRMGGALLKGWLARGIGADRIVVQEPTPSEEMEAFLKASGLDTGEARDKSVPPSVIVLAVKPQKMDEVAAGAVPLAGPDTVVLSVAAGKTIAGLAAHFGPAAAIVRVMPNTPAAIGRGVSALYANEHVTPEQKADCERLMAAVGETVWLDDEAQMDAVTAVSGSGPAYVFLLAECMAHAGVAAGLPADLAAKLARATVSGAGELMHKASETPTELRQNVTSPAGTTEAALRVLMGQGGAPENGPMADLLREAVAAAAKRSRELAG
jgi:pyrroline-5-carboxylate reductase